MRLKLVVLTLYGLLLIPALTKSCLVSRLI